MPGLGHMSLGRWGRGIRLTAFTLVVLVLIAWRVLKPRPTIIGEDMKLNVRCRKCGEQWRLG